MTTGNLPSPVAARLARVVAGEFDAALGDITIRRGWITEAQLVEAQRDGRDPLADWTADDEDYRRALALNERDRKTWSNLGQLCRSRAYFRMTAGADSAADRDLSRALELNPQAADFWAGRGNVRWNLAVFRETGQPPQRDRESLAAAAADFAEAIRLQPAKEKEIGNRMSTAAKKAKEE